MFCSKCGNEVKNGDYFCGYCGNLIAGNGNNDAANIRKNHKKVGRCIVFIIFILSIIVAGYVFVKYLKKSDFIDNMKFDNFKIISPIISKKGDTQTTDDTRAIGKFDNYSEEDTVELDAMKGISEESVSENSPTTCMENYVLWMAVGDSEKMFNMLSPSERNQAGEVEKENYIKRVNNISSFNVYRQGIISVEYDSVNTFTGSEFINYMESDGISIDKYKSYLDYDSIYVYDGLSFIVIDDEDISDTYLYENPLIVGLKDSKYCIVGELIWY